MKRFLISICIAVGMVVGVPTVAFAAVPSSVPAQAPVACARANLAPPCVSYLGGQLRADLAARGVYRPGISNRALGLVAGDICRRNDVRSYLEHILVNPDFRIVQFFISAHRVC